VDSPQFALAAVTEVNVQASAGKQGWRCVSWSPAGCTPPGGCYLAALSTDHTVRLLAPPVGAMSSEWGVALDVSELMKNTMEATGWREVDGLVATAGGPADGSGVGGSSGAHETIATAVGPGVGVGAADCNVLRLRGGAGGDKKLAARPAAKGSGGGEAAAAAAAAAAGVHEAVAGESGSDGADEPAAKRARGPDGAAVAADGGKGRRPSGVTPNARAANRRPQSAASRGAGAQTQFAVGDRVEVHNAEEGLMGGWFSARLVQLSDPAHRYGLVEYDELQASEEEGSAKLTEWFPLPGAPKLLTAAAARAALPVDSAYTVHAKRGYAVRPAPPKTLAASPPDGPLRLGCMLEVYHDGAWWGCELVGVAGPAEDLRRLAAGPGAAGRTGEGGSSGSGSGSGALLAVQLLDAPDRVEVPPERTRFRLSWDERTATWSSSRGRGVSGDVLPDLPAAYADVVLLGGGGAEAAGEALVPALVQRLEALRAQAAEAAGGDQDEEGGGDELELWSSAVEAAGQEVLAAFTPEFRLLQLDGKWLWQALRDQVASRAGASSPEQLPTPSWASTGKQPKQQAAAKSGVAAGKGAAKAAPASKPHEPLPKPKPATAAAVAVDEQPGAASKKQEPVTDPSQAPGPAAGKPAASGKAKAEGGAGAGGGEGSAKKPRKSMTAKEEPPLDFSGTDPATFDAFDKRSKEEKESGDGAALEKAAPTMVIKRFQALLAAAEKSTLRAYGTGERIAGAELRLFNQAIGEFLHLFGDKLPEGAEKRVSQAAKPRCRQLLPKAEKEGSEQAAPGEGAQDAAGADTKIAGDAAGVGAQSGVSSPKPKKERTARPSGAAPEADEEPLLDFSGTDPATFDVYDKRSKEEKESGDALALEKAGALMVFKRFQALLAAADKSTLRAYGTGERIAGAELRLFNQAIGEFLHLFGDKLPEGADKRVLQAAKPRCRQHLPKLGKEGGEEGAGKDSGKAAPAEGSVDGAATATNGAPAAVPGAKPKKERKSQVSEPAGADNEPPLDFSGTDPATFEPYDKRSETEKASGDWQALEKAAGQMIIKRFQALFAAADESKLHTYGAGERLCGNELRLFNQAIGEFLHLFGDKLPEGAGKKLVLATKPRCRKLCRAEKLTAAAVAATSPAAAAVGAATADAPAPAATGAAPAVAPAAGSTAAPSAAPSAGATADAAATEAGPSTGTGAKRGGATGDGEAAAEFPGADPKLFEPYDGRPPHQRGEGGEVLEKAAAGMVVGRYLRLLRDVDKSSLRDYARREALAGTELRVFNQAWGEFAHLYGDKLPEGGVKRVSKEARRRIRVLIDRSGTEEEPRPKGGKQPAGATDQDVAVDDVDAGDAMDVDEAAHVRQEARPEPASVAPKAPAKPKAAASGAAAGTSRTEAAAAAAQAPRRTARAAALKAVAANRKVVAGGSGDSDSASERAGGKGKPSAKKRKRAKDEDEEDATDGASSDFNASDEAEASDDDVSVDEEASEEDQGGSGAAAEDEDSEDVLEVAGGNTRGRAPKTGRPKAVVPVTRAEALLAVADAVAAATRELLDGYAPPAVNLDEDVSLKRVAHHIIANRFKALRLASKEQLHVYGRGDHLCGPDVRFWEQAAGEFHTVFGDRVDAEDVKKFHQNAKASIRKFLSKVATGGTSLAGSRQQGQSVKPGPSSPGSAAPKPQRMEAQRGIRSSAALKGNLKIGYRAPEDADKDEDLGMGGASTDGTGASESDGEGGGGRDPPPPLSKETWALTSKCIGMVPEVKYFVELSTGGGAAGPGGPAEEGGAGAYGGGKRAAKPRRAGGIPSYAIRFQGYPKDDHRFLALNAQRMASTLVACGPCVPERLYEARTLALSAVCLAWSPPYAAPRKQPQQHGVGPAAAAATTSSGSGRSQTEDQAGGPAAGGAVLARSCVLAVGNKLGQVSMWRMDMQAGPAEQRQQQLPGSGAKLQWLGMLAAAGGSNGSHVARLHWLVAPEEAAEAVDGVAGSLQGQWRVPQPNSAGPRDSLLLLTASSDGSIMLWGAPVATFARASDMRRLATLCHADGLAASCLDATWLLALRPPRPRAAGAGGAAAGAAPMDVDGTAAGPVIPAGTGSPKCGATAGTAGAAAAATGTGGAAAKGDASAGAAVQGPDEAVELDDAAWEQEELVAAGPWARRLLVVAGKPSGAIFAWRSGQWRPPGLLATAAWTDGTAAAEGGCSSSPHLSEALSAAGGATSCLRMGAHGTYHTSGVALVASRPHLMSTGVDGAVRSWRLRELRLPVARGAAQAGAGLVALRLEEVPEGVARLDPCSNGLKQLPVNIRNLPMSRQAVHAVAPSGNGLVVAVVRSAGTRGSEAVKTSMVFQRVCQATVHLLTLYGGSGGSEGGTAGVQPLTPPPPGLVGAGLLFQPPTASALWDSHAALVLRPGLSAAARLPLKGLSDAAWTTWGELGGGEGASQADDDAMLEQVQPADDDGDDPDQPSSGTGDIGRRRLAALIRKDAEERRRLKVASRLHYLAAAAASLSALEALVAPLEAPYTAAAAVVAAAEVEAEAAMDTGDGGDGDAGTSATAAASTSASLYALMGGADLIQGVAPEVEPSGENAGDKAAGDNRAKEDQAAALPGPSEGGSPGGAVGSVSRWGWSGLRTATVLRRLLLGALAGRMDAVACGGLGEALASVDAGVLQQLAELDRQAGAQVEAVPSAHQACCTAVARNEVELLQAHIWATLSSGLAYCGVSPKQVAAAEPTVQSANGHTAAGAPTPAAAATGPAAATPPSRRQAARANKGSGGGESPVEAVAHDPAHQAQPLHRLLMSDWVALHLHHSALRAAELLPLAAQVYAAAGEDPPLDFPPPGREHTALSALPVALGGSGRGMLESAMLAEVALAAAPEAGAEGLTLTLPRCACTLTLCDTPDAWSCGVCTRRYRLPPTRRLHTPHFPPLPFCLFCGVRLSRDVASEAFLLQPSLPSTGMIKLEPGAS
ncbi:hypothetical protein CHLRE_08g386000v5, partial [Chlamydomonas reinhardtii]